MISRNILRIGAGLAINLDEPLLEDSLYLLGAEGVLKTVPELGLMILMITRKLILYVISYMDGNYWSFIGSLKKVIQ